MKENLLRFNKKQKYMVFDFETCNLNLASDDNKPWQLAFLLYQGSDLIESHDYYIFWENLNISEGARRVTGFSDSQYKKKATDSNKILDHFEKYLYNKKYIKVGHNILGFDIYIHNIFRRLLGRPTDYSYLSECLDTLCLAKAIEKDIRMNEDDELLCWQFKLNSLRQKGLRLSLGSCCKKYDVNLNSSKLHDALYDIQKNYEVFEKMLWKIEI